MEAGLNALTPNDRGTLRHIRSKSAPLFRRISNEPLSLLGARCVRRHFFSAQERIGNAMGRCSRGSSMILKIRFLTDNIFLDWQQIFSTSNCYRRTTRLVLFG
jgi:hypothetical protein